MSLEMFDKEIFDLTNKELERQCEGLEMIASENFTLPEVMEVMGSILTNKYAEGYPGKRYYGGCEFVDEIETLAIQRCKKLFNCKFANVQPNSGSQANQGVYAALINPGDKILGMDLSHGGHLTHGAKVSSSGKMYESCFYGVELDGRIDYEKVREIAKKEKPKLIVCGASAYARVIDFAKFREIADEIGAYLFADIAHIAGLVVAGEHPSPFPYAHVVSSTTHKTLRGPRGGIIMTNDEEFAKKINSAIFPGIQGGPLMHVIAAKAVGFKFNLSDEWKIYAKQVRTNAQVLANVLMDRKFKLVSDGTDNHLVLMSFLDREFSGKDADLALGNAGITANKNTVPGEIRSPFITSGLRLGTPALTARGFKEKEMEIVSNYIADILDDINNEKLQENIKQELKKLASNFIIYERAMF
ncbi:TPA: serine hydroxymethyltransferase [Campylobacter jejuni]|uniref:Serine hydroxymethyltransferase n=1 Tax=Campylobacter jejuni subsp. jejuni serotype O:23/36 (strain 81-176) TaxID=354242 RepID=GLYA_CAMJJ|nr:MULTISPECIES: serine hydroxymethyltransferase [Campylobacter]A1VYC2.1 RecName: Full=Serine hydroxymethyltransferase; Short=SHMT; Short=Serine methylase [Campylobacter jejuni subsp. jejuni 81-176]ETJ81856.1 serine hydroxymethyltransferase [Campylobacter jejuni subsp. jejuni 81-176-DRH212]ETN90383.1 serine hydroxymethyltransferase [Campylobacter jejuni subsp. jejuni 81-176-UMCW9]ASN49491.1 serine hydroxymethyltransferase [Campylobacter jejuni]EAH6838484.1 serine hydroxymethyltransferase [Camp